MTIADDFFTPWEHAASNWDECLAEIRNLQVRAGVARDLAWRGVTDASWALHSSVYRKFVDRNGSPPDEADVVRYEQELLAAARRRWRFSNLSSLETLAHIQHYGGPTRLLDVSFNPLVALWFAVEQKYDDSGKPKPDADGRVFVFDATDRQIDLDGKWGGGDLPWATAPDDKWRRGLPRVWRPPSYNERIPAQNSAFLVGGVPLFNAGDNAKYRKAPGNGSVAGNWSVDDVRRATSVTLSMNSLDRNPQARAKPTFTVRIKAAGKPEVRATLEKQFGLNASSIYPDLYGLAQHGYQHISI